MSFLKSKFVIVGLVPIFVLAVAVGFISVIDPFGNWTFNPPNLTLILNAIFLTGTGIVVAAISAKSYIRQGNLNILFLGTAVLLSGLASLAAGRVLTVQTANYSVTIHNIGFFVSSILQAISAALILIGTRNQVFTKRTFGIVLSYTVSVCFVIALTTLTLLGLTPTFFATGGPTLIRQAVVALTIILFMSSCLILFRSYLKSKSMILYWYSLALGLFAIGFLSLTLQIQAGDGYSWVSKIAQYAGGLYFVLAVLSSHSSDIDAGISEKWSEAFSSNPAQLTIFFSRMFNAFTYCKILTSNEGKPIDYVFLDINDAAVNVIRLSKKDVLGKKASEIMKIDALEDWLAIVGPVAVTGEPVTLDRLSKFTGRWVHVSVYSPRKGYFVSISEDITERKQAELKLEESRNSLEKLVLERTKKLELSSLYARNLIEASLDPLVTISADGKITDVNKATEQVTGCSREQLIGSDFSDYFTEPEKAEVGYKQVFTQGFVRDYPLAIKDKSGKVTEVLYNATVYRNDAGEIEGVFAAARDITEQKKAEKEAKEAAKKLKDSERLAAIGATAGMVGHDIRNPLQAITGDLFLAKSELSELPENENKTNAIESLDEIQNNIDYINKIVADLQDYARPLNPRAQETNIKSLFNEILAKNGIPKNIKVTVKVEDKAEKIMVDPDYLKRIAANLALNAVQAMPNGGKLTICAYSEKQTNDVLITVKDTGVGIPEDIKPKLFTPMMTTKSKGQGFGLAVVKRMTEGLGGTVTFESTEGKGTTFTVRLPPPRS